MNANASRSPGLLKTGLVSVTFRQLTPREIVELVRLASLDGIEWGGDVHVPDGDIARAGEVGRMTADAGLSVAAHGSYYKVGESEGAGLSFEAVLDTAVALGAPLLRVWAGDRASADAGPAYRRAVTDDALRIAGLAAGQGVCIAWEWHTGTLTDTLDSALRLLRDADQPHLRILWQPAVARAHADCIAELAAVRDRLANIHVYHWENRIDRLPFAAGRAAWQRYFAEGLRAEGDRYALLEFVRDDAPEAFAEDAAVLRGLVTAGNLRQPYSSFENADGEEETDE